MREDKKRVVQKIRSHRSPHTSSRARDASVTTQGRGGARLTRQQQHRLSLVLLLRLGVHLDLDLLLLVLLFLVPNLQVHCLHPATKVVRQRSGQHPPLQLHPPQQQRPPVSHPRAGAAARRASPCSHRTCTPPVAQRAAIGMGRRNLGNTPTNHPAVIFHLRAAVLAYFRL